VESPIEVVRRFCVAWSEGMEADGLAAFFTDDAVYHAGSSRSFGRPAARGVDAQAVRRGRPSAGRRASMAWVTGDLAVLARNTGRYPGRRTRPGRRRPGRWR